MKPSILIDICQKLTGESEYEVNYSDETNEGQLAKLEIDDEIFYVFLFQRKESRNACFQSFPTTFLKSISDQKSKGVFCYFLPLPEEQVSKIETNYFYFMYRLMKTVGTEFINEELLSGSIYPFNTVEDIILGKNNIREKNRANNSTYVTISRDNTIYIYGKLYGANKYETVLLCYALNEVRNKPLKVYEIKEGNLQKLPKPSREKLISLGVEIETVDLVIEREYFESDEESLRSPRYNYNLLEKLGDKKCTLCDCDIPQIVQGAHIYPVAEIKKENQLSLDEKLSLALDGNNGLWLCNNHHKLFDSNIIMINSEGIILYDSQLNDTQASFLKRITTHSKLDEEVLNESFIGYLNKRNEKIIENNHLEI